MTTEYTEHLEMECKIETKCSEFQVVKVIYIVHKLAIMFTDTPRYSISRQKKVQVQTLALQIPSILSPHTFETVSPGHCQLLQTGFIFVNKTEKSSKKNITWSVANCYHTWPSRSVLKSMRNPLPSDLNTHTHTIGTPNFKYFP